MTPTIWGLKTVSSTVTRTYWNCDPIPAASINKGNFKFACKTLIGKNVGWGAHTISWNLPAAASISIYPYTFVARPPTSTPKYVVNTSLAKTTLVPETYVRVDTTLSTTKTLMSTTTVRATSTCLVTIKVTPTPAVARLARAADPELPAPDSDAADLVDNNGNNNGTDAEVELKERAAVTPTLGKPDFTYPPYGVTTIYVSSISTSYWTATWVKTFTESLPGVNTTTSYFTYTVKTVTVTATPAS